MRNITFLYVVCPIKKSWSNSLKCRFINEVIQAITKIKNIDLTIDSRILANLFVIFRLQWLMFTPTVYVSNSTVNPHLTSVNNRWQGKAITLLCANWSLPQRGLTMNYWEGARWGQLRWKSKLNETSTTFRNGCSFLEMESDVRITFWVECNGTLNDGVPIAGQMKYDNYV